MLKFRFRSCAAAINDVIVALSRLQDRIAQETIPKAARASVVAWHTPHAQIVLAEALHLVEWVMNRYQPWCTECEPLGLTLIRRRM